MQTKKTFLTLAIIVTIVMVLLELCKHSTKDFEISEKSSQHSFAFQQKYKPIREYTKSLSLSSTQRQTGTFLIAEVNKCTNTNSTPFLLVGVYTGINEVSSRQYIRKTWGLEARINPKIRLIFVVGGSTDAQEMAKTQRESIRNGDIVQGDFIDTYQNLTLKSFIFFKWATLYCKSAYYLLKIDSNMRINLVELLDVLKTSKIPDKFICGTVFNKNKVLRNVFSKWYVPFKVYSKEFYPKHCQGAAYIIPKRISMKIAALPLPNDPFPVDDAYITGILREKIHENLITALLKFNHFGEQFMNTIWEGNQEKKMKPVKIVR